MGVLRKSDWEDLSMGTRNVGVVALALMGLVHVHCGGESSGGGELEGLPSFPGGSGGDAGEVAGVGDLDTDGSGTVSIEEWTDLGGNDETYAICDVNSDGTLSNNEVQTCPIFDDTGTNPNTGEGCEPGGFACDGSDLLECLTDGTKYIRIDECFGAFFCDANVGACVCVPQCDGKECGINGCGGTCGTCDAAQTECVSGGCVCTPSCDGKSCGEDGCGGVCGSCAEGEECVSDGSCVVPGVCNAPAGGSGVNIGDIVKDIAWQGSDGQQVNLHDFCGEKQAIVMIETAAW